MALPPLRPAAFFCCVVPPWRELLLLEEPDPDFLPPRLDESSELARLPAKDVISTDVSEASEKRQRALVCSAAWLSPAASPSRFS